MSRTPPLVLSCALMVSPGGWALPKQGDSVWGNFLRPMCVTWSTIEARAENFGPEIDPRTSVLLLPEWKQLLGPDPCGRDLLNLSLKDQQSLVYQRLTSRGGQSITYYTAVAATMGVSISIREGAWSRTGQLRCGGRLSAPGNQFNWQVTLPIARVVKFRTGSSQAGNPLGSFTPNLVSCVIAQAKPAHTNVSFSYTAVSTGGIALESGDGIIALEDGGAILLETS